jgi:hypothetical protein
MRRTSLLTSLARPGAAFWLGLLAAFVLTIAACGGDDDDDAGDAPESTSATSAEEAAYFEALAPTLQTVNAQLDGLAELRAEAFDDGPNPAAAVAYGAAFETFTSERLAAIEPLTPSESLAAKHQALVAAASDSVALTQDLSAALSESPPASQAEFLELFGSLDGATITSRYTDACTALQISATSGGHDADLQCLL